MADSWSEDAALSLSLSISLASVLAGVQTSQRRLRICICILQTIEKVVKVFHAALLCFHFITHTHRQTHTWRHIRRALLHDAFLCSSCICNGSELEEPLAATSVCHITVDPPSPPSVPPLGIHHLEFFVVLALHFAHFRYLPAAVA